MKQGKQIRTHTANTDKDKTKKKISAQTTPPPRNKATPQSRKTETKTAEHKSENHTPQQKQWDKKTKEHKETKRREISPCE